MTSFIDALRDDIERRKDQNGTLKVAYVDFWPEWDQENFFQPILERNFNVVIDQQNPDVVFHSIFNRMQNTPKYKCKKILYLGENWRPGQFGSDYSISFDPPSDTNFRLPLWQAYIFLNPKYLGRLYQRLNLDSFDRFCSFTVSNGNNFMRNGAYLQLSGYKKVHSYGRYLTNDMGLQQASKGRYWREAKDEFFLKNSHKFMMTYENTPYPGYCTEKILDAFLVGSIPIYWGDPKVAVDWNNDSFVNASKLGSKWIDAVKKIDQDNVLFRDMYHQPVFKDEQKKKLVENLSEFETWIVEKIKK